MNQLFTRPLTPDHAIRRKAEAYSILEDICRQLELSTAQFEEARTSYEAVADWLSKSTHPALQMLSLYAHGSTALGTTVRPLKSEEFDVDLICRVLGLTQATPPVELKKLIGDRLREHAVYASMLEEKKRCWRINYARAFHLDISPTMLNANCNNGGELVPDKSVRAWKPTNPTGYRKLFERRCALQPRFSNLRILIGDTVAKADVKPFPAQQARSREIVLARWGLPSLKDEPTEMPNRGTTNIRHPWFADWKGYLGPEHRCLVPFTRFAEPTKLDDGASGNAWFAIDEGEPLAFFAGLWTRWVGTRRKDEGPMEHLVFGFFTTEPNYLVGAIHPNSYRKGAESRGARKFIAIV